MLQDAAPKFFATEFVPHNEQWLAQGKVDRDAWQTGRASRAAVRRDAAAIRRRRRRLPATRR